MNNSFCVLPFYGAEFSPDGKKGPCCLLPDDYNLELIKSDMLDGKRNVSCNACWKLEDRGIESDRQLKNKALDFYADKDIRNIVTDCKQNKNNMQIVKFYTSNLCNGTCVTCNSDNSTAWASLSKRTIALTKISTDIYRDIDFSELKMMTFVGGEPLLEKHNFAILERLITVGNTDCFVSVVTNGSITLNQGQKEILSLFKNLNICLSIDGVGKVFEYLRYPLQWDVLLANLNFFRSITKNVSASYTISNLNSLYYKETVKWFAEQGINYNHNIVTCPSYFSPTAMPDSDNDLFLTACKEIYHQDQLKGIDIKDYLPEFYKLMPPQSF